MFLKSSTIASILFFSLSLCGENWPQAAGPNNNFQVKGSAPKDFSVSLEKNVVWRTPLPNTGQGTPVVSNGKVFVTSHQEIHMDTETGSLMLGLCFDAKTGKELWRREIPGTRETDFSSLFSDNTAASPVADGERVVFTNVGGTFACYDYEGKELWTHTWTPFGRHHARQHEPILHDGNVIQMHAPRYDLPVSATTKAGAKPYGRERDIWTWLMAYDLSTGKKKWQAKSGTSVHSTSMINTLKDGRRAILTGRGGGHQPPEEPYGLSMIDASNGNTIWDAPLPGYAAHQIACWDKDRVPLFLGSEHLTLDPNIGKTLKKRSIMEDVTLTKFVDGKYVTLKNQQLAKAKKSITYMTNILIGDYHYFRSFEGYLIGRVHLKTQAVEYLQVPPQVIRKKDQPEERSWNKALPNDMKNASGFRATKDKRNAGSGWGHVSAASPIVVGDYIYFPTMVGMVYVLKWNASELNEDALVSISDLGPAGETWSLSSLAYADGKLYARTLKELICIGGCN